MKKVLCVLLLVSMIFGMTSCRKVEEGEVRNASTVEEFAEAAGVSTEFAQSLNDAVGQVQEKYNRSFDISDVYNFRETDPWASGKRYTIWLAEEYVLTVYEENDRVASIRTSNGEFVYQAPETTDDGDSASELESLSQGDEVSIVGQKANATLVNENTIWVQVQQGDGTYVIYHCQMTDEYLAEAEALKMLDVVKVTGCFLSLTTSEEDNTSPLVTLYDCELTD